MTESGALREGWEPLTSVYYLFLRNAKLETGENGVQSLPNVCGCSTNKGKASDVG